MEGFFDNHPINCLKNNNFFKCILCNCSSQKSLQNVELPKIIPQNVEPPKITPQNLEPPKIELTKYLDSIFRTKYKYISESDKETNNTMGLNIRKKIGTIINKEMKEDALNTLERLEHASRKGESEYVGLFVRYQNNEIKEKDRIENPGCTGAQKFFKSIGVTVKQTRFTKNKGVNGFEVHYQCTYSW